MSLMVELISTSIQAVWNSYVSGKDHLIETKVSSVFLSHRSQDAEMCKFILKTSHIIIDDVMELDEADDKSNRSDPAFPKSGPLEPQLRFAPAPKYMVPDALGWARHLMSHSLFEKVFEPCLNDMLADRLEQQRCSDANLVLTSAERWFVAIAVLMLTLRTAVGDVFKRSPSR